MPETKIILTTFDNELPKLKRLNLALKEAIQKGYWIVIENAHGLKEWPIDILNIIYVCIYLIFVLKNYILKYNYRKLKI